MIPCLAPLTSIVLNVGAGKVASEQRRETFSSNLYAFSSLLYNSASLNAFAKLDPT